MPQLVFFGVGTADLIFFAEIVKYYPYFWKVYNLLCLRYTVQKGLKCWICDHFLSACPFIFTFNEEMSRTKRKNKRWIVKTYPPPISVSKGRFLVMLRFRSAHGPPLLFGRKTAGVSFYVEFSRGLMIWIPGIVQPYFCKTTMFALFFWKNYF